MVFFGLFVECFSVSYVEKMLKEHGEHQPENVPTKVTK